MFIQKFVKLLNPVLYTRVNKRSRWTKEDGKYFSDFFDLTTTEGNTYRNEKKIPFITKEQLEMKAALFDVIGITSNEWLKYPILFKESHISLEQQYLQLQEAGFCCINAALLSNYKKCRRKKISLLKALGFLEQDANVAKNFASHLNPIENNFLIDDFTDESIFEDIHHKLLARYLEWRLNTTHDAIETFFRVMSFKSLKSFRQICENLNLLESIGYTPEEIMKYGYLLKSSSSNLKAVLEEVPSIAGIDTPTVFRTYPRIIGKPPSHYIKILKMLKDAEISDKCIQNQLDIFAMKPETLKVRLEEMKDIPELNVLRNSANILKIIRHHNSARSRAAFLQDIKFKCLTATSLSKSPRHFDIQIREGKDVTYVREVVALLKRLLHSTSDEIEINLRKHPYCCYVSLLEIQESYLCLKQKLKFSDKVIMGAVQIVLYSSEKIKGAYKMVTNSCDLRNEKLSKLQQLNLMLYFIEKDHHFTGNGIWRDIENNT